MITLPPRLGMKPRNARLNRSSALVRDLEHLYAFDNPAGAILEDLVVPSGRLQHGSTANNWTAGPAGFALSFNANGNIGANSLLGQPVVLPPFSVIAIFQYEGADGVVFAYDQGINNGYRIQVISGTLNLVFGGVAVYDSTFALTSGRWYLAGITCDANGGTANFVLRAFPFGTVRTTSIGVGTVSGLPSILTVGAGGYVGDFYAGRIAYIAHYSRVLVVPEILAHGRWKVFAQSAPLFVKSLQARLQVLVYERRERRTLRSW